MKTVCIQIGNSDDKLTQKKWHTFIIGINGAVQLYARDVHFTGFSKPDADWQNACWVFTIDEPKMDPLMALITRVRHEHSQDSVAWMEGDTIFI